MRRLNFSGAPALLIARAALGAWGGIMMREPPAPGAEPDFTDSEGNDWYIHDAFDFEHPRTDYERLCGSFPEGVTERVLDAPGFAISDGSDSFAWWPEERAILTNDDEPGSFAGLTFEPCGELAIEGPWVLMNSSVAGAMILAGEDRDEYMDVDLPRGRYRVERATRDGHGIYRLRRIDLN